MDWKKFAAIPAAVVVLAVPVTVAPPAEAAEVSWAHPAPNQWTSSNYGIRDGVMHNGHDIAGPTGTIIQSVGKGKVVKAGWWSPGYGISVLIDHGTDRFGNHYLTHYAHLNSVNVSVGDTVDVGQRIGTMGSTGDSTGPHLHFEVHKGKWFNPVPPVQWMKNRDVNL